MRTLLLSFCLTLAACATPLPQVLATGPDTFDVRYDQGVTSPEEVAARAEAHCPGALEIQSETVRFDAFAYRTYRCPRP